MANKLWNKILTSGIKEKHYKIISNNQHFSFLSFYLGTSFLLAHFLIYVYHQSCNVDNQEFIVTRSESNTNN